MRCRLPGALATVAHIFATNKANSLNLQLVNGEAQATLYATEATGTATHIGRAWRTTGTRGRAAGGSGQAGGCSRAGINSAVTKEKQTG